MIYHPQWQPATDAVACTLVHRRLSFALCQTLVGIELKAFDLQRERQTGGRAVESVVFSIAPHVEM